MPMKRFYHSGDLGDVIYSLPTIRRAGGGVLTLYHHEGRTWHGMDREKADSLRSLLIQQDYIDDVEFIDHHPREFCPLNGFRDHCGSGRNLADAHLSTHAFPFTERDTRWLSVDAKPSATVLFARTQAHHRPRFIWNAAFGKYAGRCAFIGTTDEHAAFVAEFGDLPHIGTPNLLAVAQAIAGCALLIANQSCVPAIAEGLKHPLILEVAPGYEDSAHFVRPGAVYGYDDRVELPEL